MVTMKALDTLHISNVRAENLLEGDVFNVSESEAKILEDRGLAERGGTASKAVNANAVAPPRPETRDEIDADRGEGPGRNAAKAVSSATAPASPTRKGK